MNYQICKKCSAVQRETKKNCRYCEGELITRIVCAACCSDSPDEENSCPKCHTSIFRGDEWPIARTLISEGVDRFSLAEKVKSLSPQFKNPILASYKKQIQALNNKSREIEKLTSQFIRPDHGVRFFLTFLKQMPLIDEFVDSLASPGVGTTPSVKRVQKLFQKEHDSLFPFAFVYLLRNNALSENQLDDFFPHVDRAHFSMELICAILRRELLYGEDYEFDHSYLSLSELFKLCQRFEDDFYFQEWSQLGKLYCFLFDDEKNNEAKKVNLQDYKNLLKSRDEEVQLAAATLLEDEKILDGFFEHKDKILAKAAQRGLYEIKKPRSDRQFNRLKKHLLTSDHEEFNWVFSHVRQLPISLPLLKSVTAAYAKGSSHSRKQIVNFIGSLNWGGKDDKGLGPAFDYLANWVLKYAKSFDIEWLLAILRQTGDQRASRRINKYSARSKKVFEAIKLKLSNFKYDSSQRYFWIERLSDDWLFIAKKTDLKALLPLIHSGKWPVIYYLIHALWLYGKTVEYIDRECPELFKSLRAGKVIEELWSITKESQSVFFAAGLGEYYRLSNDKEEFKKFLLGRYKKYRAERHLVILAFHVSNSAREEGPFGKEGDRLLLNAKSPFFLALFSLGDQVKHEIAVHLIDLLWLSEIEALTTAYLSSLEVRKDNWEKIALNFVQFTAKLEDFCEGHESEVSGAIHTFNEYWKNAKLKLQREAGKQSTDYVRSLTDKITSQLAVLKRIEQERQEKNKEEQLERKRKLQEERAEKKRQQANDRQRKREQNQAERENERMRRTSEKKMKQFEKLAKQVQKKMKKIAVSDLPEGKKTIEMQKLAKKYQEDMLKY